MIVWLWKIDGLLIFVEECRGAAACGFRSSSLLRLRFLRISRTKGHKSSRPLTSLSLRPGKKKKKFNGSLVPQRHLASSKLSQPNHNHPPGEPEFGRSQSQEEQSSRWKTSGKLKTGDGSGPRGKKRSKKKKPRRQM